MQRAPVRPGLVVGAQSGSDQAGSETRVRSEQQGHNQHIPHNTFIGRGGEHRVRTGQAKLLYIPPVPP